MKIGEIMKKFFIILFTLVLFPFSSVVLAQEVSFDIIEANLEGQIKSNGSVEFKEIYTFDVDFMNGTYHIVDYGEGTLTDYRIGIRDRMTGEIKYLTESMNGLPGTFRMSDDGSKTTFKVFNPAENETLDFVFEYTLNELITNYQDTAEINRVLVGQNTDDRFEFTGRIYLPGLVENSDDFRAWGHGPANGQVNLGASQDRAYIDIHVPSNPPNQFIEVHSIFPTSLTPNNKNRVDITKKDDIIRTENDRVESDRQSHQEQLRIKWIAIVLMLIASPLLTLYVYYYYFSNRRKLNPKPANIPEHMYSLPEDITPAIMATSVLRKKPTADDFSATIIDLARKGYIEVQEVEREKRSVFSSKTSSTVAIAPLENHPPLTDLHKHERYVYEYLLPDNQPVVLSELEELIKKNSHVKKQQFNKWLQFSNYVEVMGEKHRNSPIQKTVAIGMAVFALVVAIISLVGVILLSIDSNLSDYLWYFIVILAINVVAAFIILILASIKQIRTYEEDRSIKEWKAFANMLDNIGNFRMRDIASLPLWEEFLAYAVSLNVADKVIEAMNQQYGADELVESMHMPTNFYRNPYWINNVMRQSMSSSIASAAPKQNYSGTNRGGFGGGFSSGSSGGSGMGGGTGGF